MKKRILVFPCGSEVGLEIYRSLRYSRHFDLIGASSTDDHGMYTYENYIGDVPFYDAPEFIEFLNDIVRSKKIDAIYPAMDSVAEKLQLEKSKLDCIIIGSDAHATSICASKLSTYNALRSIIPTPAQHPSLDKISEFPVFIKPDRGYGSRGTLLAENLEDARNHLRRNPDKNFVILEYLPGKEWTVDCFSDRTGNLIFCSARTRNRVSNGISVNTTPDKEFSEEFKDFATEINRAIGLRGAWFFQMKQDKNGSPKILEVAARLAGSSSLFRCTGVNFALLSAFDAFEIDVVIEQNDYDIKLDRALSNRYKMNISYNHIFIDLDDCILINDRVNAQMIFFIMEAISNGKSITLITRHKDDLELTLKNHRIRDLFDRTMHIKDGSKKSNHIDRLDAIFIDDSFEERAEVSKKCGIATFSPDMIEALI